MFYHNKTEQVARHRNLICYQKPGLKLVLNHNKSRALAHQTSVSQTFRWLWHGFWLSDRRRPGCPDYGKINDWSKLSQNHISQIIRERQQLELQHVPESKCVAHISDAVTVIRSELHVFTFSQGLATSKYCKHPI